MKATFNGPLVLSKCHQAANAILSELAERTADAMQNDMNRDTGFMRDTTNAIPPSSSGPGGLSEVRISKWAGPFGGPGPAFRFSANGIGTLPFQSAVHVPAIYAFWVNLRYPFAEPAVNLVISQSEGIVSRHRF